MVKAFDKQEILTFQTEIEYLHMTKQAFIDTLAGTTRE